ncbi:DNA primase [Spiroplasma chinense]|uniref:DNA primase n=1 Tax=Spiroplasma chinense TaxID=216932 RepID=A0A5B9Y4F6_9MOLU|nr:DNA primase [Spiroplasma chinense]QEH62048.1 DNA primase [Spiroplasma chinense]
MAINQHQIDNLINKVDIVDVVSKYIDVQKKGRNYLSICPFHDDSDPSMHISPDKKIFKCFVCGTGGNVITFVQEFNNVTFFKALSIISKDYNLKIDGLNEGREAPKHTTAESRVLEINKAAADFFNGLIISNHAKLARAYLNERFIKKGEISKFNIGYAASEVELYEYLIKKGFEKKDIVNSGLIYSKGISNKCFFENRIVFPILDDEGNTIGFSGRAFKEGDEPKYKNSMENIVFKKSQLAYNFSNAKKEIRVKNEILILEGFMDVISLERVGIFNSVAIMGTSFTDFHVKLFSKVTKNFKLFLDGDKAGVKASLKTAMFLMDRKINVTVISNKTGKDPDELVIAGETNLINQMIKESLHPIDFAFEYYQGQYNIKDSNQLSDFVNNMVEIISHETNLIVRESSISKLSNLTGINEETILNYFTKLKNNPVISEPTPIIEREISNVYDEQGFVNNEMIEDHWMAGPDEEQGGFFMESLNDFDQVVKENHQAVSPSNNNKSISKNNLDILFARAKAKKNFSEAGIILDLLKSNENLELIEKNSVRFENTNLKLIAKFIIEKYKSNNYNGDDFQQIANELSNFNKKLEEVIYYMKNILFLEETGIKTKKAIEDAFDKIEVYKIAMEVIEYKEKIDSTNDYELQKTYLERIEWLLEKIKQIESKWRE